NGGGLGASQIRKIHSLLSLVLHTAVRSNKIAVNPAAGVKLPRLPEKDHVYLDHPNVEALATAAGTYRPVVLLLAYTGLRYGEAAPVCVRSVEVAKRRVRVVESFGRDGREVYGDTAKTHEGRTVPAPPYLVEVLFGLVPVRAPDASVFTDPKGGPLRYETFG